jgi:hypothetical protein
MTCNSASDGTDIKLSEMALAIARMEQQQQAMFAVMKGNATTVDATTVTSSNVSNVPVTPITAAKQMSTKETMETALTSENRVIAATLHNTLYDSNSDNNYDSCTSNSVDSGTMATETITTDGNSNNDTNEKVDNNVGIGPMLDITAYNRFESTLAKLQVHASDIVRVDKQPIGTGGFAKVYKVMLKGNQLCAAKVSANCCY